MVDRIQRLANEITQKVQPELKGQDMSIVIPAFIQVTLNMAMFGMDCGPREAADMIIDALQDAKTAGMN